ncbi:Fur family zinc uptake transcriptional regulator [Azospirillum lipoferum]|uniref:Transcriptional repressor n=1 Tax=Azospirillum lipoferum TaxID=193 RepID=A0A5A9GVJ6_AZOLI|nr:MULTISPECIES: Fur family transcriptional regulator [Azospirillum]KAA0598446.1 transcriptional repressor [Azospirillum lipoferum]MCP1609558.1 Fur family zinc uptake transcriptional regulator [Azospirillum lipoferum]MDW5535133.1 Fur family transcriptional regulator [Azospirillum sp. NL1]
MSALHDHTHCIADALTRADALCAERGARLTALRRRVLELVWSSHRPRGAYAILEDLSQQDGKAAAPLTVYRALEFLVEQGLVHRIESLNAYVGCAAPGDVHSGQFLVCEACGDAAEIDDPGVGAAIIAAAAGRGFRVQRPTVEVRGLCKSCQETSR